MLLKNNRTGSSQLTYLDKKKDKSEVEYIHIPAGATVEIEDHIFNILTSTRTTISVQREEVEEIETGANPIEMDRKPVKIKTYYETGKTKEVNLLREAIKRGEYSVVTPVELPESEIDKVLNHNHISVKDMSLADKQALYEKLA